MSHDLFGDNGHVTPERILEIWNELAPDPIRQSRLTIKRRRHLFRRIAEQPDTAFWEQAIGKIADSLFCRGLKGWTITFDALCERQQMAVRAFEGIYDYAPGQAPTLEGLARKVMAGHGSCRHSPKCRSRIECQTEHVHALFEKGHREPHYARAG
tara:strand:+ start:64 stop:528 length:465 start_codon:yes stop_codon:yes gene_type:complete